MLIKVSQKILEKKIIEAQKLTEELEKIQKEFEEKIEPIRNTLNKSNKEVIDLMREIDATQLVVKKVLVKLEQKKKKGGVFVVD
jgi:2-hydroxy-3-keto-5-methylthiopentenyl-1-phosphate phosphatase